MTDEKRGFECEAIATDEAVALDSENQPENEPEKTESEKQDIAESNESNAQPDELDYAKIIEADIDELRKTFPELSELKTISELENPMRFAALRDLGLSASEAYLATATVRATYDNRAHLKASVPGSAGVATEMSRSEYAMARDIFTDLSDSEIRKLYRKVTK